MRISLTAAAMAEIGDKVIENCNVPSPEDIINATRGSPLSWNMTENFSRGDCQNIESYHEQKFAINAIQDAIDTFSSCTQNGAKYVKCVGVHGIPGGGKSFVG